MTNSHLFPFLLLLPACVVGCSNYSHLSKDLEGYRPPVYSLPRTAEGKAHARPSEESGFALEKRRISEARALWEKALKTRRSGETCF